MQNTIIPKKPPDKLRTTKCAFNDIVKDKNTSIILFDAVTRTHKIVIHTYQFIRLWILHKYHNNQEIPIITEDTIKMTFKVLVTDSCGPKPQNDNLILFNELNDFYHDKYSKVSNNFRIKGTGLSQILSAMATDMITNINNNIQINFISYIKRFVNSSFRKVNNELIESAPHGTKVKLRKELNKDLFDIKEDLLNNTLESNEKYHNWIKQHRNNILPTDFIDSYSFDVKNFQSKYIQYMIYMCLELEKLEVKSFQFFPMRTNIIPKNIPIDTKSIIELLINKDHHDKLNVTCKQDLLDDIMGYKNKLWSLFFNLDNPIFSQKSYSFDYRILTDCFSVSIQLIHNSFIESEIKKKMNMKNKKNQNKEACKDMSNEDEILFRKKLEETKKQLEVKKNLEFKQKIDKLKKNFKTLSDEEQQKIHNKKYIEFPYIEELNKEQIDKLENSNWIVVDPGKKNLLFMKNKLGKKLRYSNITHLTKTKRLKYHNKLKKYKDINKVTEIENKLSLYNSKTCDYNKFLNYVKNKNIVNYKLFNKYEDEIYRKHKWFSYINRKRAETDLIKLIKRTYGKVNGHKIPSKDIILCYGDWSCGKQMRGRISTPNLGLKRKLAEYFTVYNLDEFRTSILNHKTENKSGNLHLSDKTGKIRKLHSVLTCQGKTSLECVNRDDNSVNNMIKIVNYFLEHNNEKEEEKMRPERFRRSYKFEDDKVTKKEIKQIEKKVQKPKQTPTRKRQPTKKQTLKETKDKQTIKETKDKQTNTQKIEELKLMLSVLTSQTEKSRRDSLKISHQIIDNLFLLFDQKLKGINPQWSNVCPASEVQLHTHEECDFFLIKKLSHFSVKKV
jgi:hypothetical protein